MNSDATEFSLRRNLPQAQVQREGGGRTFSVVVSLGGKVIASMTEILKRGKVASVHYFLSPLDVGSAF
jgi:hypothetical protein